MLPDPDRYLSILAAERFNGHPPLGVNATDWFEHPEELEKLLFQWAPTLGGECYKFRVSFNTAYEREFQWAPTLGGECYMRKEILAFAAELLFQWAPTLGGECYTRQLANGLFVNLVFQWAPTLGGECYASGEQHG